MPVEVACTVPTVQQVNILNKTSKHTYSTDTTPETLEEMKKQPAAKQHAVHQITTLVQDEIQKQQPSTSQHQLINSMSSTNLFISG